jgi:hypothetical protein
MPTGLVLCWLVELTCCANLNTASFLSPFFYPHSISCVYIHIKKIAPAIPPLARGWVSSTLVVNTGYLIWYKAPLFFLSSHAPHFPEDFPSTSRATSVTISFYIDIGDRFPDMDGLCLSPRRIPEKLYRVHLPDSWTALDYTGFVAADTEPLCPRDERTLARRLRSHDDRHSKVPSIFISVFSDRTHAENWASKVSRNKQFLIAEINGWFLRDSYVFNARNVHARLGLRIPRAAGNEDEYLVLHYIPRDAIVMFVLQERKADITR